tara:strand:+ start:2304 stop:2474 length:171 start_codon:yes stop_codon:yes gene_type:complete
MRDPIISENCGDDWDYLSNACKRHSDPAAGRRRAVKNRYQRRARRAAKLQARNVEE